MLNDIKREIEDGEPGIFIRPITDTKHMLVYPVDDINVIKYLCKHVKLCMFTFKYENQTDVFNAYKYVREICNEPNRSIIDRFDFLCYKINNAIKYVHILYTYPTPTIYTSTIYTHVKFLGLEYDMEI